MFGKDCIVRIQSTNSIKTSCNTHVMKTNTYFNCKSRGFTFILFMLPAFCLMGLESFAQNWDWQNPLPQGVNLFSVNFPNDTIGYSVGMDGKILKTVNGGDSWFVQESGVTTSFSSVFFTDIDTGYVVGFDNTIHKTTNGGADWLQLPSPSPGLTDAYFVNSNLGYAVGSNGVAATILKTENGGLDWVTQNVGTVTFYNTVFFVNDTTGYVAGGGGKILKTTDGGNSWVNQTSGTTQSISSLYFTDEQNGYAVSYGKILKTTNGGTTWTSLTIFQAYELYSVKFTDANTGYAAGRSGIILKTINAGATWSFLTTETNITLRSVFFTDALNGMAVGESGIMLKTTDAGLTWVPFSTSEYYADLNDAHFASDCHGVTVGDNGTVLKTIDGGANWIIQNSGVSNNLNAVHFTSDDVGYVVGTAGFISKTTNGGTTWTIQTSGLTTDLNDVYFTGVDTGFVVGTSGNILKTTDGGANWLLQSSNVSNILTAIHFVDVNLGFVVGSSGRVLKTTNGGSTWNILFSGTTLDLNSVYFPTAQIGYIAGVSGHIRKTTNGGTNWTQLTNNINIALTSLAFTDASNGYAVGYDYNSYGKIFQTTDGGNNWSVETISWDHDLNAVNFVDENILYIVGNNGAILKTKLGATTNESSASVCVGESLSLQASAVPGASYSWSGPNDFTSDSENPSIEEASTAMSGIYTVLISLNNCTSTVETTTITIDEAPAAPVISNTGPLCEGSALALTAEEVPLASYAWTGPNGFSSAEQSPLINDTAEINMGGVYTLAVTVNNCTSELTETIVAITPIPAIPIISNDGAFCEGSPLSLTAEEVTNASYAWTGPNGFSSTEQSPLINNIAEASMGGIYTLAITVNNCTSEAAETVVEITPIPATPTIIDVGPICEGSALILSVENIQDAMYAWTGPNGFTSSEQNPTVSSNSTTNLSGTYEVVATVGNCSGAAAQTSVIINETPDAPVASGNSPVDEGTALTLFASTITGAEYNWTGPNGFTSTEQNPTVSEEASTAMAGTYEVSVMVNGCESPMGTVFVEVNEVNSVNAISRDSGVHIYPNPTAERIWIELPGIEFRQVQIINALGAVVLKEDLHHSRSQINVGGFAPGIYYVVLLGEGRKVEEKMVIGY